MTTAMRGTVEQVRRLARSSNSLASDRLHVLPVPAVFSFVLDLRGTERGHTPPNDRGTRGKRPAPDRRGQQVQRQRPAANESRSPIRETAAPLGSTDKTCTPQSARRRLSRETTPPVSNHGQPDTSRSYDLPPAATQRGCCFPTTRNNIRHGWERRTETRIRHNPDRISNDYTA